MKEKQLDNFDVALFNLQSYVIYESGEETINIVIGENHFLKVVVEFQAVIAERLLVIVAWFACYRINKLFVKQAKIFWRYNCVSLLIAPWEKATVSAQIFLFPLKLKNHIKSIDITAAVDCQ